MSTVLTQQCRLRMTVLQTASSLAHYVTFDNLAQDIQRVRPVSWHSLSHLNLLNRLWLKNLKDPVALTEQDEETEFDLTPQNLQFKCSPYA